MTSHKKETILKAVKDIHDSAMNIGYFSYGSESSKEAYIQNKSAWVLVTELLKQFNCMEEHRDDSET